MKHRVELSEEDVKQAIATFCMNKLGGRFDPKKVHISASEIEYAGRLTGMNAYTATAEQE